MNNRRGVTLIELLVAMSVSGLVLIAVLGIFGFTSRQLGAQTAHAQTILLANQAMNAMTHDIHNSISVQNDANGNPTEFILPADTDAFGNYIPSTPKKGTYGYQPGSALAYQLSDTTGNAVGGTNLWRYQYQQKGGGGGLLGGLLGVVGGLLGGGPGGSWVPDTAWSLMPTGPSKPPKAAVTLTKYPNVSALTFSTAGMPANTVQITLTMTGAEGSQTSNYTVSRCVYFANHN